MGISSYKDLLVWQKSFEVGMDLYKKLHDLPKYELYALGDQMRRCIISISSNIAEGHARSSSKEFIHFLSISRGSIAELQTQILFAIELNYFEKEYGDEIIGKLNGIDIMISNLIKKLKLKI